jgi:hypothetical protein
VYAFAADEVIFRPRNDAELSAFLAKYGGAVLYDGSKRPASKLGKPLQPAGAYLLRVNPKLSALDDLPRSVKRAGMSGRYVFSSMEGARLTALVGRERLASNVSLNFAMHPTDYINETQILEGKDGNGNTFNYANQPYTTATLDLNKQQLGIGVVRAWDYLWYKGIPFGHPWRRPVVAIIDGGFALDTTTGAPLNGNLDFEEGRTPVQLSENWDGKRGGNAGGTNPGSCSGGISCPYHGTGVFSVAAAVPRNQFGAAGTGSDIVKPYLIRVASYLGFEVAQAVEDAVMLDPPADVINLSMGTGPCGQFCSVFFDGAFTSLTDAVFFARGYANAVVVASAGNSSEGDNNRLDNVPCTLDGVLCVGAINFSGTRRAYAGGTSSGAGSRVSIWAPDCIPTTPDPTSNGMYIAQFCGTSASAPFVAGIVSLMKALNPNLSYDTTRQILQATALKSPDPVVTPGYINALGAVMAVSPNQPPTIGIIAPLSGSSLLFGHGVTLNANVVDPEQAPNVDGMNVGWSSNVDGALCTGILCDSKPLSPGSHTITVSVTDPFGATASASASIQAVSGGPPSATILYPANTSTFFASQQVNLRGFGSSPNEFTIPDARLQWSSSAKGVLGTGSNIWVSLPIGIQTITLTVTDPIGQTGSSSIQLNVKFGADYPTVKISSPADFSSFGLGAAITLTGTGSDPVDGMLPGQSLRWVSDIDGPLGQGNQITVKLSGGQCAPLYHHITLSGTNKAGNTSSFTITVLDGQIC